MKKQCPFDPTIYVNAPMGMFHCPWCDEMQMAGMPHLPSIIEIEQDEYDELVKNMAGVITTLTLNRYMV